LEEDSLEPHKDTLEEQFSQAITPSHFLAYYLHPKHKGEKLKPEHIESAQQLLVSKNPELLADVCYFHTEADPFPKTMFHTSVIDKLSPCLWWKSIKSMHKKVNPELCDLATLLLQLPPSSASIEHIFSSFGAVQTKLRNRLGIQKAAKLVACYRTLRGKVEIDW
jgi:hypothetical protein